MRLMRTRGITIRVLARRMNITIERVRYVRTRGVRGEAFVRDWLEANAPPRPPSARAARTAGEQTR